MSLEILDPKNKLFMSEMLTWKDDDYFCSQGTMPASPDTVCLDKHFIDITDNLLPLTGIFGFDPEILEDKGCPNFAEFEIFDEFPQEKPGFEIIPSIETRQTISPVEKPARKRSKASSSDEEEPKVKKAKATPRVPRSRMPTSAYRGVSRCTKDGRWQARIRVCKEVVYLGRFPTEEQAARRYDEAARLNHGKSAMLNFVTQDDILCGRKSVFTTEKTAATHEE